VIAAQRQRHQRRRLARAIHHQRLDQACLGHAEERRDVGDGVLPGSGDHHARLGGLRARLSRRQRLGLLDVGGVITGVAERDRVFAGIRQHVEFVRFAAPDAAGVGDDGAVAQPDAIEDTAVRPVHPAIGLVQRLGIEVEGVGILHDEFARAHHAEARADLVTELGLDLVEVDRQLAVAAQLVAREVGDHFLVRGAEAERALMAVIDAQQLGAVLLPAPRFLPQLGRLHHRHQHFLCAAAVHFLAHDGLDLAQHAQTERQPGIESRCQAADQAGAQHQLVADYLGVRRCLLEGGYQ
jgi:hypothetical protein